MSREAGTRGHVTGVAGRLRAARCGAITSASALTQMARCDIPALASDRTPLAGMRPKRMLPVADKQIFEFGTQVTEATA